MRRILGIFVLCLLVTTSVSARTRVSSIYNFLDQVRLSDQGFANTLQDTISVQSTSEVIQIAGIINYKLDNPEDVILYFQNSQNQDYGFGLNPSSSSDLSSTIDAISGLTQLGVNSTKLDAWNVASYINSTAYSELFTQKQQNNMTIYEMNNLTIPMLHLWYEYLNSMFLLNVIPQVPFTTLTNKILDLQMENGTYSSFEYAIYSILVLKLLGFVPWDVELSTLYLIAHIQDDGLFSTEQIGPSSIEASYLGILALSALNRLYKITTTNEIILNILDLQQPNSGFSDLNSDISSIHYTWYAIQILNLLDAIDELSRPDVLQTNGFLDISLVWIIPFLLLWRRKHE